MNEPRLANKHFIVGVIILAVGVVLLLDQLGLTEITKFWPLILIYFGVNKLSTSRDMNGRFWGGFLTLLGISFQLEELGVRGVRFGTIWPVFLICVGVLLILRRYESRNRPPYYSAMPPPPPPTGPPDAGGTGSAPAGSEVNGSGSPNQPEAASSQAASPEKQAPGIPPAGSSAPSAEPAPGGQAPPPPPPNYGSGWDDPSAWRQPSAWWARDASGQQKAWWEANAARHQQKWERFQRRMERMSERANRNWQSGPQFNADSTWRDTSQPALDEVHIFWGGRRRIISKNFMGGDVVAIFGGFEIDLTQADFQGPEIDIEVVSIFGGGEIRVPTNWEVIVESVGIFGGTHDRTWHPQQAPNPAGSAAPPAAKRLIIKGVAIFGGLTLKN